MEALPEIKKTLSWGNKESLIVDNKYLFNLKNTNKDNTKVYTCKENKIILKCPAYIKIKDEKVTEISNEHNHNSKEEDIKKEEIRKEMKTELVKSKDPFSIKIPKLFKSVSVDKGIRGPSFQSVKSGLYKNIAKVLPPEVDSFDKISDESIYYKTSDNQNFLYFKNKKIVIFQSLI